MALTEEQQAIRAKGIGSSEIDAVCGISPYQGPYDVWMRKTGRAPPFVETAHIKRGRRKEAYLIDCYEDELGVKVAFRGDEQVTFVHPRQRLCVATPDGIVEGHCSVEAKAPGYHIFEHWADGEIPIYYTGQLNWTLGTLNEIAGYSMANIVAETDRLIIASVPFDPEYFAAQVEMAERFWVDHVLADVPPPVDATLRAREWLAQMYPRAVLSEVASTPEIDAWAEQLRAAVAVIKEQEALVLEAENNIKEFMRDHACVRGSWGRFTWKNDRKGKCRYKDLALSLGATKEQIDEFTDTPGPRKFCKYFEE